MSLKHAYNIIAKSICFNRSATEYEYDNDNKDQIVEILKYLICDTTCKYELNKGLFLMGGVGTGKTMIIEIIREVVISIRKNIEIFDARNINSMYKNEDDIRHLCDGLICIDDLGTEDDIIKDFGTKKTPMHELISARYRKKRYTIMTSNLTIEMMNQKYDIRFMDRCNEMFNIINFNGKSRRK